MSGSSGGRWLIDGNNVMGSRPDGWWRDRSGAKVRLADDVARWARLGGQRAVLVFDGRPVRAASTAAGGAIEVRFADRRRPDAADDEIVALAGPGDTVVTADRGLIGRLPAGVEVVGPAALLAAIPDGPDGARERMEGATGGG